MVHFALLLLLAQAFLHSGGVMPQERVDFYHAVLKASGMATFPEAEEAAAKDTERKAAEVWIAAKE